MSTKKHLLELLAEPRTREQLCELTHRGDRWIRETIKELTSQGYPIINLDGAYKLTNDMVELESYLKVIRSYEASFFFTYRELENILAKSQGKRAVTVRQHTRRISGTTNEGQIGIDGIV